MHTAVLWFRQDLRLADNPALTRAVQSCERVIPVYIHDPDAAGDWTPGGASRWWLHHSLVALDASLRALGSRLLIRSGRSLDVLRELVRDAKATHVYWNRLYEPWAIARDREIKQALRGDGLIVESANAALLFEPWDVTKDDGSPYKVFTPFWKACVRTGLPHALHPAPDALPEVPRRLAGGKPAELELLPSIPWDGGLAAAWTPGESGALQRLDAFLEEDVTGYRDQRDRPDLPCTSRLSPYLHFGEISPRQAVAEVERLTDTSRNAGLLAQTEAFVREIGWREFAYHLLFHFPQTTEHPLDRRFERFQWQEDETALEAWRRGRTGVPMVDAGIRELWHTGWMHNRVRMIVASYLTKNLLIHWLEGDRWFWDTLVDADLASNTLGWQWTAGCGADAAPFFRIFNPVLQGEKFDPSGDYVRRWVPELAALPNKYLQRPWETPVEVLNACGIRLGRDYPDALVDLKGSRERALARFDKIKNRP